MNLRERWYVEVYLLKRGRRGLFPTSFEGVTLAAHIFGYPLRPFGTAESVEFLSGDSTRQVDDDRGLNSRLSHTFPTYIEQNPPLLTLPATDFNIPLESDQTPSVLGETADAERRQRLRQILMNVGHANRSGATRKDLTTAFRGFSMERKSVLLRQRA